MNIESEYRLYEKNQNHKSTTSHTSFNKTNDTRIIDYSTKYVENVKNILTLDKVSEYLERNVSSYNDITYSEYKKIYNKYPSVDYSKSLKTHAKSHFVPLLWNRDWEYGYQSSDYCKDNKLYYLRFFNFMMLDMDNISLNELKPILFKYSHIFMFYIHETYNGFHVFVMSHAISHFSNEAFSLMESLGCDPWYVKFSYNDGYKIRLNKKKGRGEEFVSKPVGKIGDAIIHPHCKMCYKILKKFLKTHSEDVPE